MPNHVFNTLKPVDADVNLIEQVKEYTSLDKKGNPYLDFNKIIPMPDDLNVESTSQPTQEQELLYENNLKEYGYPTWYQWRPIHWGTKWNSYGCEYLDNTISFQTAWNPPTPVIKELAKKIGKGLRLEYTEEGYGAMGEYHIDPEGNECYNEYSTNAD